MQSKPEGVAVWERQRGGRAYVQGEQEGVGVVHGAKEVPGDIRIHVTFILWSRVSVPMI